MGLGKALKWDTLILLENGSWKFICELTLEDRVVGSDGLGHTVLGVYPQGIRELYRVTFSDGSWVDCDDEHLWTVNTPYRRWAKQPPRIKSLNEIRQRLTDKAGNRLHFIPMVSPIKGQEIGTLPLDPYLLGALIGDGTFKRYGVGFSTVDAEMLSLLEKLLPEGCEFKHSQNCDYYITNKEWRQNHVLHALNNLFGDGPHLSREKYIPTLYLTSPKECREALLQGLLDTDGHVTQDNNVEFATTSDMLACDVREVVQSLGGIAPIRTANNAFGVYYRMSIALPGNIRPFRLSRKAEVYHPRVKYPPARSIVSVEPVGKAEAVCISVDTSDKLFIVNEYILTHNTVCTIAAVEHLISEGLVAGGLLIVPSALKYQWAREVEKFTDGANVLVIDGTPKQRREQYFRVKSGEVEYAILNYEQVVNDWEIVSRLPRDFIVLDEATYIKSPSATRTKRVRKLEATYKWALTGQPVENKAEELYSIMQWVDPDVLGNYKIFDSTFISRDSWGKVKRYKNLPLLYKTVSEAMVRATWAEPGIREQMPRIVEDTRLVPFNSDGAKLYRSISFDLSYELSQMRLGGFDLDAHYMGVNNHDEGAGTVMSRMMALRMLCDHPDLIRWSASNGGSEYCTELVNTGRTKKLLGEPKLLATVDLIKEILEEDPANKVVLFSYFKYMLDLIGDATEHLTIHTKFTGSMNAKQKDQAKIQFQTDSNTRLFLSSDAGGYGVDLPQANYLLSYDLPFSAGALAQRQARIVRLSTQFDHVTIISVLMAGSIEERIYDALTQKQSISDAIVDGRGFDQKGNLNLSLKSLTDFLNQSTI